MSGRISALSKAIPQSVASFASAHSLNLSNIHLPTPPEIKRRLYEHRGMLLGIGLAVLALSACGGDPNNTPPAATHGDWLKEAVERNPFVGPQFFATVGGVISGLRTLIVEGSQNFRKADDPDVHNFNYLRGGWNTLVDVAANASTGMFLGGGAAVATEIGISPKVLDMMQSQLPLLGTFGFGMLGLNIYKWIDDIVDRIRFSGPPTP